MLPLFDLSPSPLKTVLWHGCYVWTWRRHLHVWRPWLCHNFKNIGLWQRRIPNLPFRLTGTRHTFIVCHRAVQALTCVHIRHHAVFFWRSLYIPQRARSCRPRQLREPTKIIHQRSICLTPAIYKKAQRCYSLPKPTNTPFYRSRTCLTLRTNSGIT